MSTSSPVVVVTSGRQPLLRRAVASLRPPLWLVSPDPDVTRAARRSDAERIPVREDAGFAAAANAALEHARRGGQRVILLLNDDACLLPGARSALEREASRPGIAAAGALILEEDGRTVQAAGLSVGLRGGRVVAIRPGRPPTPPPRPVRALPATALALRVDTAVAVGGFDAVRFPFYFEDVDLCLRLRDAGYRLVLVPDAQALHRGGATAGLRGSFASYHAARGQLALCRVHPSAHPLALAVAALASSATLLRSGDAPRLVRARALLRGLRDGWKVPRR